MRFALLNYSPYGNAADDVSNRRFARAAAGAGHRLDLVSWSGLRLEAGPAGIAAAARTDDGRDVDLAGCDCVLPRFDARDARDLALVLTAVGWLESLGVPTMPSAEAIAAAEDKLETAARLARLGLPAPRSAVLFGAGSPLAIDGLDAAVEAVGGYPVVVKAPYGWGGRAVALAESRAALRSWVELAGQLAPNASYLVQVRIPHAVSITAVGVGGVVVADGEKAVAAGEFRTNVRLGSREAPTRLSAEERDLALRALAGFGIEAGSVDIARSPDGPVILEVNACTGIGGPHDDPIADHFIAAAETVARRAGRE
jgi:ribosomal protein S6--L-glutamate ligase